MQQVFLHEFLSPKSPRIFPPWEQRQAGTWQPWNTYPHQPGSYLVSKGMNACVWSCWGRTPGAAREYISQHWDDTFERFSLVEVSDAEYRQNADTFRVSAYTVVRVLTKAEVLSLLQS